VERPYGDEDAVFFMNLSAPETCPLAEIDARIRWFKDRPLGSSSVVRRQLLVARQPRPIRRLLMWAGLNLSGRQRARMMGTFGVTVYSGLGAESLHPISPLTTTLTYGIIDKAGSVPVRVIYDHRTLDGATMARAMGDMESFLTHEILAELRYMQGLDIEQGAA
jgi:hypothetical protein